MAKFEEIWDSIDKQELKDAIAAVTGLRYEITEAEELVEAACRRWLVNDMEIFSFSSVEKEIIVPEYTFKFIEDLAGNFTGNGALTFNLSGNRTQKIYLSDPAFAGRKVTLDWKTTTSALDASRVEKHEASWQWRLYSTFSETDYFIYRDIKRISKVGDEIDTKETIIETFKEQDLEKISKEYITGVKAQRDSLIDLNISPWPRRRPFSCGMYGRTCVYKRSCDAGGDFIPTGNLTSDRLLSYSRLEEFNSCPEKHRRAILDKSSGVEDDDGGPEAALGSAVHRGLGYIYKKLFNI